MKNIDEHHDLITRLLTMGFCRRLSLIRYVCDRTSKGSKGSKGSHIKLTGDSDVKDINKVLYLMPHHEDIIFRC
jgi:hypothetical protein